MPAGKRPAPDATALRHRLADLRRRLRFVAALRGSGWLLGLVLALAATAGALDFFVRLPDLARAVVLAGTLAGGAVVAFRHLFRPLAAPADDLSLALRVEEEYPGLNDSLASAVQFLGRPSRPEGESEAMEREAVRRALARASGYDFGKIVDRHGVRVAVLAGGAAVALAATLFVMWPAEAGTALLRLGDPFGGHDWPKKTLLEVEEPRPHVGRGETLEVRGRVRGVIPEQATVVVLPDGLPPAERPCAIKTDGRGEGRFALVLGGDRGLQSGFRFQVRANDAVSREYRVDVLPPPGLTAIDGKPSPQLRLHYPAYTGLPSPEELSPGTGNVEAVLGTDVVLRARADRRLVRAWLEYRPELPSADLSAAFAPLGAVDALSASALSAGGREVWDTVPALLEDDRATFTIGFRPRVNGMYALHLEDESGLRAERLFELRLRPDPAPQVRLDRPAPSRDVLTVLPTAELPLEVVAEDPQYGIRDAFVEYRTRTGGPVQRLSLYDHRDGPAPLLAPLAGVAAFANPARPRPTRLAFRRPLRVADIHHPEGEPLREGDVVVVQGCADDYDDVTVDKEPGRSHQVEIRIVGRNALEVVLDQEQARLQQDILRLRQKQREAQKKVADAERQLRKGQKPTPEDQESLLQAEQAQQQIRERVGDDKEGLRADAARLLQTLRQNGLEDSAARERLRDVARELDRLGENELQQIEPKLSEARRQAEMLDDKARAERQQRLRQQSRQAEQEAKDSDEAAARKEAEAERARKEAERAKDADRDRLADETKRQRERAQELRRRAADLRRQAERDRREAERVPDPDEPQKALAEARRGQEAVERSFDEMLKRLEPWGGALETRGEAGQILEEQKKLQAETEKLMDPKKDLIGKKPEDLDRQEWAELDAVREEQQKLEERARQLLDRMDRQAEQQAEKDPEAAAQLREAAEAARKGDLAGKMKAAREQLERNELAGARDLQQQSAAELQKLAQNLRERREADLDRLAKKMRQAEKDLDELIDKQERLQKKVKEAAGIADPKEREQQLQRLAKEQAELHKKAQETLEELARLRRAQPAGQDLGKAGEQMEEAARQLTRGEQADDKQEEALDRLDDAREELKQAREQAEEQLEREQMTRVKDLVVRLKERQESLLAEAQALQKRVQQNGRWTEAQVGSLRRLRDSQKGLGEETAEAAEKQLEGTPVFARTVKRAAEAMGGAAERAGLMAGRQPAPEKLPDAELARLQEEARRRLAWVVEAVKEAENAPKRAARAEEGGGDEKKGRGRPDEGISPVAQYKMLRDMQADVNKRTDAFRKKHPDATDLTRKEQAELDTIRRDQQDVRELLELMGRAPGEPDADKDNKDKGDK
jgi:hypothetical protein